MLFGDTWPLLVVALWASLHPCCSCLLVLLVYMVSNAAILPFYICILALQQGSHVPAQEACLTMLSLCALQFRKLVRAIQNIALTLNRHYPARLHRLFLVGAPAIVHLPVRVGRPGGLPGQDWGVMYL